jgi:hypothetical protein
MIGAEIAKVATKTPVTQGEKRPLASVEHAVGDTKHVLASSSCFVDDVGVGCG